MTDKDTVCGTCCHHKYDGDNWTCANDLSDNYGMWTGYSDECDEWSERE